MTRRSLSSPTMPLGLRSSALVRCLPPACTWRKASHATRQTSAILQRSTWAKTRGLPAASMPLGPSGCWGTRIKPWPASARPWRWRTRCRIPIVWRGRGVWQPFVSQLRHDVLAVHEQAEAAVTLATEQGFSFWAAGGTSLRGWALAMQGQGEEGMAQVRQGTAALRATGAALYVPYFCTVLADVCDHLGHTEDGLQALAEAHTIVEQQEERWWEAEVCRLRGVLLLRQPMPPQEEAEAWLQRALDVARRQEAKGWSSAPP